MRVSKQEFQDALAQLEKGHQQNANDTINPKAAKYFSEVLKIMIPWWEAWIDSPYEVECRISLSHHQLTKFAAVISAIERQKCADVADLRGAGDLVRGATYFDWWQSRFPFEDE